MGHPGAARSTLASATSVPEPSPARAVDAGAAFLRAQCSDSAGRLRAALASSPGAGAEPGTPADTPHEAWLELIAATRRRDTAAAEHLTVLYAWHGQVAGTLERLPHRLLPAEIVLLARTMLLRRLDALTEEAVLLLGEPGAAGTHPQAGGRG